MEENSVINLTNENFESEVLNSEVLVLVDFWAEWCGTCRIAGAVLGKIADEYEGKVKVCKVDVDEYRDAAVKASVQSLPTLNIYKAGQIVDQITGIAPTFESDLKEKIESHL